MGFLNALFGKPPYPSARKQEVEKMITDLTRIGEHEDFLAEHSGGLFNAQFRNIQACEIGKRLNEMGGFELMEYVYKRVQKKLSATLASHLSYAWADIGKWVP